MCPSCHHFSRITLTVTITVVMSLSPLPQSCPPTFSGNSNVIGPVLPAEPEYCYGFSFFLSLVTLTALTFPSTVQPVHLFLLSLV